MTIHAFEKATKALLKAYDTQPKSLALQLLCLPNLQQLKGLQECCAYSSAEEFTATGQPWQTASGRAGHKCRGKPDQLLPPLASGEEEMEKNRNLGKKLKLNFREKGD